MDSSLPKNRLGLAKWLFSNENPLTSRVTVNRYWQMIFGFGLVRTPEDFGVQGMLPSHPELLDWMSIYLIENNWDIKKLLKLMVMSYTYQQKSSWTNELKELDPGLFGFDDKSVTLEDYLNVTYRSYSSKKEPLSRDMDD